MATYIPELGKADPEWFGICLVTADGVVYEVGDTNQTFTIQSISKPFAYGVALEDNGRAQVLEKIWIEPTGEAFNSISLQPGTGRPLNPMINAGAIAATGLVQGATTAQKIHRVTDVLSRFAGRPLAIDENVYRSESETGHRNRAIAHMLRNFDILTADPTPAVEAYFRQCSILVNCRDLAVMAATLANGGENPVTGQRAVVGDYVASMMSVMSTCGMYDAAGEWIYHVGIPAKSGVAGGILAVLPGQLGIGVFSPRLDSHGNSTRGIAVCRELSERLSLHLFQPMQPARSVIRRVASALEVSSKRVRTEAEQALLQAHGGRVRCLQFQGELQFGTVERLVREALREASAADHVMLGFRHVLSVNAVATRLLAELAASLTASGRSCMITGVAHLRRLDKALRGVDGVEVTEDADVALETLENRLLERLGSKSPWGGRVRPEDCELLQGLDEFGRAYLLPRLVEQTFAAGAAILRAGAADRVMYFVLQGVADAFIDLEDGQRQRVSAFSAGMSFGELALLDASPRSASVFAHTEVVCTCLTEETYAALGREHPEIMVVLLRNLALVTARRLRRANLEIRAASLA
jgi:glutaminase